MMKKVIDILFSAIGIIILLPIFLIISILIKYDSKGCIFYKGIRTGLNGKPFKMIKFRTMVANAEKIGGTSTSETDPRITKIGHILRKYKLDELPQLFNIIKGEMSFVGPRPEVEEYTCLYSEEEREILRVRPGITDYSSIRFRNLNSILANSSEPDRYFKEYILPEKNRLRLKYAKHNNLWIDFKIVLKTLYSVIFEIKNPEQVKKVIYRNNNIDVGG